MKRIANYRSGDRAEALGIVLLQSFCAVAPVPRQEDFGLVDAVATLLRRDGRVLYAEDSFSVQFKSRTEKVIEYLDKRFMALLAQDLPLFIGQVDIRAAEVKLYSIGAALTHFNVSDSKGLAVYFNSVPQRFEEGMLHTSLGDPVLRWSTADLADRDFERMSYGVMKQWLELDRWNRRYRKMGMQMHVQWKTNEAPVPAGTQMKWDAARGTELLGEVVPAVQMIACRASNDPSFAPTVLQLIAWLRGQGVDPDPGGLHGLMLKSCIGQQRLAEALSCHPEADVAVLFFDISHTPADIFSFWAQSVNREKQGGSTRYEGSVAELRAKGFSIEVHPGPQERNRIEIGISIGPPWLNEQKFDVIGAHEGVFLLRKVQLVLPQGRLET